MAGKVLVSTVSIFGKNYSPIDGMVGITPGGIIKESAGIQSDGKNIKAEKLKATELSIKIGYDSTQDYNSEFLLGVEGVVQLLYRDGQIKTITGCAISNVDDADDGVLTLTMTCDAFIDNLTA
jgi:hypothetical protein